MASSEKLQITVVGTNHKHALIELRERLYCHPESLPSRLKSIMQKNGSVEEAVILSTCNRTEIYLVTSRDQNVSAYLTKIMSDWSGIEAQNLGQHLYSLTDQEAVRHLIEVASGVDSLVAGEQQIQGQVRKAARFASQAGTIGRCLSELFQAAYRAASSIRNETGIGLEGISVSSAAISLLKDVTREHPIRKIMLVGAGKMISLAAEDLSAFPGIEVCVANRTIQRAKELAERFGGKPIGFGEIPAALQGTDAVLTCTASTDYVIRAEDLQDAGANRDGEPLILIDTSVPRNIDPSVAKLPGLQLYNIDDLSRFIDHQESRRPKIARAEELASKHAEILYARIRAYEAIDILRDLRKIAENIREKELSRAMRRLGNVSDREKEIVDLLTQRIVNKLLHEPTARLKEHASNGDGKDYEAVVRELFAIDRDGRQ